MTKPISLAAHKWGRKGESPNAHSCREALEVALAKIDAGEIDPDHIIVVHGRVTGEPSTGWFQAGKLDAYGPLGLLTHVLHLMERGE